MKTMNKLRTILMTALTALTITGCTKYNDFDELDKARMVGNWNLENITRTNKCNGNIIKEYTTEILTLKNNYIVDYKTKEIYIDNKGRFNYYYRLDTLVLERTENNDCPITSKYIYIRIR